MPATATPSLTRISSPSISARGITGMPRALRGRHLRVVGLTALEMTTTSALRTCSARWPTKMRAAQRLQAAGDVALALVGARDRIAEVQQHLGDTGHADTADADEVDG